MEAEEDVSSQLMTKKRQFEKPLRVIKATGVLLLLMPFFIVFGMTIDIWNNMHASPLPVNDTRAFNASLCDYLKSFPLSDSVHVSVCVYQGSILIDFRRFMNNRATIKGIQLNPVQWEYLKRIWPYIDQSLVLAPRRDFSANKKRPAKRTTHT